VINITVFLVDNEPVRQAGFRTVLSTAANISVVGACADLTSASQIHPANRVDVVLLASGRSLTTDLRSARELRLASADSGIVFVRNLAGWHEAECLLASGVNGCISPDVDELALVGAVMIAATGGSVFCPSPLDFFAAAKIEGDLHKELSPDSAGLTGREREVLGLLSLGMSNRIIAEKLCLSANTVKKHVSEALRKTRQPDRFKAGLYARRHGLAP
jgi:DNA-binding NarL/FixJ family response regulator